MVERVKLGTIAHARSGDKGDASNVGLIAYTPELYAVICREVTPERVKAHFRGVCRGEVDRYEVPNLLALNFILHDSLGGGGTASLQNDAQGKTHGQGLLELAIDVPAELLGSREVTGVPPLLTRRDGDLLFVTLNDPERANALSPALAEELIAVYRRPWRAEGVRALILAGAGRHFCAGADLDNLRSLATAGPAENQRDSERLRDLFAAVLWQPALTVAAVQGSCVAGGCGLATACDFVVAAEDARFMYSEVRIGFVAALVATFLPLRCRGRDVRELLLNPDFVDATRALELGLVNRVVPAAGLAAASEALAVEILTKASSESIARSKQLLLDVVGLPLAAALDHAATANAASRSTADCQHGVATFLATKKAPSWR